MDAVVERSLEENEIEAPMSDHEDGEISDDDDETPIEISVRQEDLLAYHQSSEDEKSPEDVIKAYAEKVREQKKLADPEVDPKLCRVCFKAEHKYRCPRCNIRTCSLNCSKQHKAENECDGVRQPFSKVDKLSQYDPQKSIDDQKFMQALKDKAGLGAESAGASGDVINSDGEEKPVDPDALRYTTNSATERYLLNAARSRHVWLGFTDVVGNESRHEQHSDTVFWNMKLIFKKQKENGEVEVFEKTVMNIPETIRLVTVLKQFFKPRQYGCIVSEGDLDVEKLKPFIEHGVENINVHMEVHARPDRFYGVIANDTILESTRNRVVADHPKFIITLKHEFLDMQLLSPEELEEIKTKYGGVSTGNERFQGNRGRGGGGRGFHRGGGRGGGNGGGNHQNNFRGKRSHGGQGGYDGGFKRGRGGNFNGGNRRGGYQNRNQQPVDSFDPFEPFAGPTRLPMEYNS